VSSPAGSNLPPSCLARTGRFLAKLSHSTQGNRNVKQIRARAQAPSRRRVAPCVHEHCGALLGHFFINFEIFLRGRCCFFFFSRGPAAMGSLSPLLTGLPDGIQDFPIDLDWLGVDKDESHHTRLGAAVDPIVDRSALHEHVAGF